MQIAELVVTKDEVEKEVSELKLALKAGYVSKRTGIYKDLMAVYGHLKHGGKVVDLFRVFREHGLNERGHPKLAIVPFSAKYCYLYKRMTGGAIFSIGNKANGGWSNSPRRIVSEGDVEVPADTFDWDGENLADGRHWRTVAPIVPGRILTIASAKLTPQHYHILFEAESWSKAPIPPKDPILGKMLTPNIFGIIATWDLTDLERSVIAGRL